MKKAIVCVMVFFMIIFTSCYVVPPVSETPQQISPKPSAPPPTQPQPQQPQRVCESGAELIVGTEATELYPAVNPVDTNLIAYTACGSGEMNSYDIWIYRIPEKSAIRVTTEPNANELFPSWTKDGEALIFDSDRIPGSGRTLWQIDVPGGLKPVRLLLSEGQLAMRGKVSPAPGGNPDIVFESPLFTTISTLLAPPPNACTDMNFPRPTLDLKSRIWTMHPNGTGLRCLVEGASPAWSPLGDKIAYASNINGNWDIWIMDSKGGNQIQLTSSPSDEIEPTWSPDGKSIAFASNQSGNWDIWVIGVEGGPKTMITSSSQDEGGPCWATNGYIYYHSFCRGNWDIWRIPAPALTGPSLITGKPYKTETISPRIQVLNGTRIKGLAAKVAQALQDMGYNVVGIGNARTRTAKTTTIYYALEFKDAAKEIALKLQGDQFIHPRTFPSPGSDITIVVGKNMK